MSATWLWVLYAGLVGLCVGSFLNVLIYRVPRGLPWAVSRSRCPSCGQPIAAWDNIPLLSYLILLGRCRTCRERISVRYPLVEALTAALFVACLLRFGLSLASVAAAVFCLLSVALAFIDAEHYLLPDLLTLPGVLLGLAASSWVPWTEFSWRPALLGAVLGGGLLWAIYGAWLLLRKEEGMGLGDAKMLAMQGAFLGWKNMLLTLLVAAVLGSVVGVVVMRSRSEGWKTRLPFGTFLAAAGVFALFFGPSIVAWYSGFLSRPSP
ncbi:MAG TPA: prepilin peptidase [Thermoanaerobaculia bacterium]|nr:prepilin peptidase [Thermoanaerobaculia bacterium]